MHRSSALYGDRWNRKLVRRQAKRLFGQRPFNAFHLKQNPPWLNHRDPHLRRPFALSHAGLKRFFRQWFIREDANPDLTAALEIAGQRHARRLDFARAHPAPSHGLESEVAEGECRTPVCCTPAPTFLELAIFYLFRFQHRRLTNVRDWIRPRGTHQPPNIAFCCSSSSVRTSPLKIHTLTPITP